MNSDVSEHWVALRRMGWTVFALTMLAACSGGGNGGRHPRIDADGGAPVDLAKSEAEDMVTIGPTDLAAPSGNTGGPCTKKADCAGTKPFCVIKDANDVPWPGGYCGSGCHLYNNDPTTGINPDCPGGNGTCRGTPGSSGYCYDACDKGTCKRQGYSCFQNYCEPTALSQCNPTVKGSCGTDMACIRIGVDNVGECTTACDPFAQLCVGPTGNTQGCYASADTGEGVCSDISGSAFNGDACQGLNGCDSGLGCYWNGTTGVCRPFCGGPNNVACDNGMQCVDSSPTVQKTVIGLCGG